MKTKLLLFLILLFASALCYKTHVFPFENAKLADEIRNIETTEGVTEDNANQIFETMEDGVQQG